MDLPTCPSCGQSVLDDDAVDCPFCGESMSAKPGRRKGAAPQAKAAPQKPATKPAARPESDDPFEAAPSVTGRSVPLLPRPAKGKQQPFKCPMCETVGYQSKQAAGRDVKCANKDCLVPIFKAPALQDEAPQEAAADSEPKSRGGLSTVHYIVISVVAAAGLGGIAFMMDGGPAKKDDEVVFVAPPPPAGGTPDNGARSGVDPQNPGGEAVNGEVTQPAPPPVTTVNNKLQAEALKMMVAFAQQRDGNDDKPTCRRLSAEAYAIAGDVEEMGRQLTQLEKVGPQLTYYRVLPAIQLAWHKLEAGDQAGALAAIDPVVPEVEKLPPYGQFAFDTMSELGVLLTVLGRGDEVADMFARREQDATQDATGIGQMMESVLRCQFIGGLTFDRVAVKRPALGWTNPQRVAVTVGLTVRGTKSMALAWARRSPSAAGVRDCLAAWGEASILVARSSAPMADIRSEVASLPPSDRAWVLCRCAAMLHEFGDAQSKAVLGEARSLLAGSGPPAAMKLPDAKRQTEITFNLGGDLEASAVAAAELAHVESLLGQNAEAAQSLKLSMDFTRAMAPGVMPAKHQSDEVRRTGEAVVMAELKSIHSLQTDDEAKKALLEYANRCKQVVDAAESRFTLQQQLLSAAAVWGPAAEIWNQVQTAQTDAEVGEPWFDTTVPAILAARLKAAGDSVGLAAIESAVGTERLAENADARVSVLLNAEAQIGGPQFAQAVVQLERFAKATRDSAQRIWQQEVLIRLASRLVAEQRTGDALTFMAAISDPQVRITAYELVAGEAATRGDKQQLADYARTSRIAPPDKVAILRALIGVMAIENAQAESSATPASET